MKGSGIALSGVHLLLTYKCIYECDHCFVWSGPGASGTMTIKQITSILRQAKQIPTVKDIFFEGGEPFLFFPVLVEGVRMARKMGFSVGIVSNAYWGTDVEDSELWLRDLAKLGIGSLTLSTDTYHGTKEEAENVKYAAKAAKKLGMSEGEIEIQEIDFYACESGRKAELGQLYFRGRAADKLAPRARKKPWRTLEKCPEEPPGVSRVHVDAHGNVLFCQGISIGNVWKEPLSKIASRMRPEKHPVIGPLASGGPAELCRRIGFRPASGYADDCHLCYAARCWAREQGMLTEILVPDECYGVFPDRDG